VSIGSTDFTTSKLVEPGREERAARVETTRNRKTDPTPSHHGFDTTSSQSEQAGSTNFTTSKLVEPGSEKRAARVETTRQPKNRPDPKPPWFRHDQLADAREDRLNQLCERFGTTCSLTLVRMLNQLSRPATASPP